jgi:hypothetical protein
MIGTGALGACPNCWEDPCQCGQMDKERSSLRINSELDNRLSNIEDLLEELLTIVKEERDV